MKKFILGILVGVAITAAGSAYADDVIESIVGKTIQGQFPVKVDGKQLEAPAAVVDGTSYLPVRAIGEALNMDVTFNADLGIELKEKGAVSVESNATTVDTTAKIAELREKIKIEQSTIDSNKQAITVNENLSKESGANKEMFQKFIDMYNKAIGESEAKIADYEQQLAALQTQQ